MLGYREKGTLIHCWWACKLVQALWKTAKRCLKKSKQLLHYPATSRYLSKEYENSNSERCVSPYAHCSFIYNSQSMKIT